MRHRGERGSVSVELVLLTPVLVGLLCLTVAFGRIQNARADVEAASRAAARAASIERSAPAARVAGERAATAELDSSGYRCDALRVDVSGVSRGLVIGFHAGVCVSDQARTARDC